MRSYFAYIMFLLALCFLLLSGDKIGNSPVYAGEDFLMLAESDSLNILENYELFIIFENNGSKNKIIPYDSPWPQPDTSKHP